MTAAEQNSETSKRDNGYFLILDVLFLLITDHVGLLMSCPHIPAPFSLLLPSKSKNTVGAVSDLLTNQIEFLLWRDTFSII